MIDIIYDSTTYKLGKFLFFVFVTFFYILPLKIFAQTHTDEIGTASANDFYISKYDRYYTNGNQFYYRHALKQDSIAASEKRILELEAGQKIFNPFYAKAPNPLTHDRPFTAYLYTGAAFNWFYSSEKMFRLGIQLGTIGPDALGEEIQTSYHKFLGVFKPAGWEYQLKNEFGINLSIDYNQLLFKQKKGLFDVAMLSNLNVGNTFSGINGGLLFRVGKFNKMYESSSYNSIISNPNFNNNLPTKKEFFFYYKPIINVVAYDATIQGGMFIKDKGPVTFDAKPLVFTQDIGANFSSARWSTSFFVTLKSKEVQSTATAYSYATWVVCYRFSQNLVRF